MRTMRCVRGVLMATLAFSLLPDPASAMRPVGATHSLQESGAGAPLGRLNVRPEVMAGLCITMVSPIYPQTAGEAPTRSAVVVRVVIWKSGNVSPMRAVSGQPSLQAEAMNAVRLWHYKPFSRDGEPVDVTTDVRVNFDPGKPGGIVTHPNH
jgi:TonB family protein